jgi:hypothetical protein
MGKKTDNRANLFKNRNKFIQLFTRQVKSQDLPLMNRPQLQKLLNNNRRVLEVTQQLSLEHFIGYLVDFKVLKTFVLNFPHTRFARYGLLSTSLYAVVGSFYQKAYFSHYSALYLHQLTEQIPKTLYYNLEQTPKPTTTSRKNLLQENIDRAFRKPQRQTNNQCIFEDSTIVLLNGKSTHNEGVESLTLSDDERVKVTGIERTLIDIAVRPGYSGGVQQVLSAFERAKEMGVSINRLSAILKRLNYIYPYHQVIGFYLEKAGYSESQLAFMERQGKDFDFYLDYGLQNPVYSKRWRLYIPQGF